MPSFQLMYETKITISKNYKGSELNKIRNIIKSK